MAGNRIGELLRGQRDFAGMIDGAVWLHQNGHIFTMSRLSHPGLTYTLADRTGQLISARDGGVFAPHAPTIHDMTAKDWSFSIR